MKRFAALALTLALTLALLLCGCASRTPADTTLYAMDTAMTLRLYGDTDGSAAVWLQQRINELDAQLDPSERSSALSLLNTAGSTENADLLALAQNALALGTRTDGALDATLLPALRLWGFYSEVYRIPSDEELNAVKQSIGQSRMKLNAGTLTLEKNTALDFGALAKGYAADCCRAYLEQRELSGVLSLGGNVQTVGSKGFASPWAIGIANPDDPSSYLATLSVTGTKSIVTSGDYQRYFEFDGARYCHIFDPATASPVQSDLRSVTVVADSGVLADGLSTALFVMGFDEAVRFWQASDDFEVIFVGSDGAVYVTAGLEKNVSDCSFSVLAR